MKTNFEKVTASPKDLAFFIACNVKCDDCIISAFCKKNITEELVDHLYEVHKGGASVERQAWIEKHKERIKMQFRGWLKQPHTPIS